MKTMKRAAAILFVLVLAAGAACADTLNHDRSLSKLLTPYDRIHALMERYTREQIELGIRLG